jgi:hypothetical protein
MSRRHSTSPDSKPITTRLHKLTALLDELAKAPHQPDDATAEFLPTKLLKRVLAYVGSGGAAAATNNRWRRVAANPELWRDAVQRAAIRAESRETADGRARQQAKDVILALRAASRALAATPGSRIAELRDAMAAAARRQRRAPTDVERPVLEASCDVLGLNSATVCSRRPAAMAYSVTRSNHTGVALPRGARRRAGRAGREAAAAARRRARGARRARFGAQRRRRRAPAPLRARRARPASPGILATVGESHGTLSMYIERRAREARRGDGVEGSNAWRGDGVAVACS